MLQDTERSQHPEQQPQRLNYHEEKFPDGMIKERRWETPEGARIAEGVERRGYWKYDSKENKGSDVHEELITSTPSRRI